MYTAAKSMKDCQTNEFLQTIAAEFLGVVGRDIGAFIARLGHLTASLSSEHCEAEFLLERLSLAIVVGTPNLLHWLFFILLNLFYSVVLLVNAFYVCFIEDFLTSSFRNKLYLTI